MAVRVLGPLAITGPDAKETKGGVVKARELIACLAVHPAGVTADTLASALWPEADTRYVTSQRKLALRKAREMLRATVGNPPNRSSSS